MTTENPTVETKAVTKRIVATLTHGKTYFLGSKLFEQGKGRDVTEAERDYLEEHAVDPVDVVAGGETTAEGRSKFKFHEGVAEKTVAPKRVRRPA